jgi:putative transcriptional regulator
MSQRDVAAALGISQSAYARIEAGKTNVSLDRARELSALLNVSLDHLFFGEDSSFLRPPVDTEGDHDHRN